jgi:hypothetical protein
MPMIRRLSVLFSVSISFAAAQVGGATDTKTDRVVNEKYAFSVVRPNGWYAFLKADTPCFFNFRAEEAPSDGSLPPNGASICVRVELSGQGGLRQWAAKIVRARHGSDVQERPVQGPGSPGIEITFAQLPLGTPDDTLRTVLVIWQTGGTHYYGAELTYIKGDPHAAQYEGALEGLVRGFRPL